MESSCAVTAQGQHDKFTKAGQPENRQTDAVPVAI
jgi:hypothetical protein